VINLRYLALAWQAVRAMLSLAYTKPNEGPHRAPRHWDFLLKEMQWMAVDFGQVRGGASGGVVQLLAWCNYCAIRCNYWPV
jgi:HSA